MEATAEITESNERTRFIGMWLFATWLFALSTADVAATVHWLRSEWHMVCTPMDSMTIS
jgi:hypothetical protein